MHGLFRQRETVDHRLGQAILARRLQVQHVGRQQAVQIALDGIGNGMQRLVFLVGVGTGNGTAGFAGGLPHHIHIVFYIHGLVLKYTVSPYGFQSNAKYRALGQCSYQNLRPVPRLAGNGRQVTVLSVFPQRHARVKAALMLHCTIDRTPLSLLTLSDKQPLDRLVPRRPA